ncbi:MAG: ATP-dependent DNA helicase PcrA [Ruminococcaceae bacterium]|nr:ATP-dependent DNA helicase PcrA [Oscillospiraceae bacterium]
MDFRKLKGQLFDKYFGFLNPRQREAVYTTQGPLLVLAGAGSGKTTVIVNRIANILLFGSAYESDIVPDNAEDLLPLMKSALEKGDRKEIEGVLRQCAVNPAFPFKVLCITFTNKAAKEFKARLESALGPQANDIWAGTFHSVCVRILRRHIDNLGYDNSFTIYDTDDSKKLIVNILKELGIAESVIPPKMAMSIISRAKENQQTVAEFALDAGKDHFLINIAKIYRNYQEQLKSANALDFDDIIMLTNRLFEEYPEVLERYQNQFEYILVDEYQDTNPSQSRLVSLLSGSKKNVCVVGDDDQSIYSFRGATVDNILGFDLEYGNARVIRLEQNYRSTGNILNAANGIIQNNRSRKGKELWTDSGDGEKVYIKRLFTQNEEASFICDTIRQEVEKGAKYSDFAILYRVNALSSSLETAFVKKKIPYRIFGGIRFYERREIKDILAYLSVIANPADSIRLRRIINVPKRSIGDTTVEKIGNIADETNVSMFTVLSSASGFKELLRVAPKLEKFGAMINDLRDYAKESSVADLVSRVIEVSGYRQMLAEEDDGDEREENILELVSAAALFEETAETPTLSEFLNEISLVSDLDNYQEDADSVVLMTVHSAKGLEFPTVFIAGFEEGLFPSSQSFSEGDRGLEEERRLAYVAVTRAKKRLYLLHTSSRMLYGRTESRQISRFATEIPENVCEKTVVKDSSGHTGVPVSAYSARNKVSRNSYLENIHQAAAKTEKADFIPVGSTVAHPIFGKGEILSAEPMGGDVLYEIEFANGSIKRLMGNFAKLKKC